MVNWSTVRAVGSTLFSKSMRMQLRLAVASHAKAAPATCTCGYQGQFGPFGVPVRSAVACPRCGSVERHRLLNLAMQRKELDFAGLDVIHFAPEPSVQRAIRDQKPARYRASALSDPGADLSLDLHALDLPDASVDAIVANHIFEHVDDRRALAEVFRVLRPGGMLVAMIPLIEGWEHSYEDASITSDEDRHTHFGQFDHVRYYGADFRDRVREAGFDLEEITAGPIDAITYRLQRGEKIFVCRRPAT